MRRFLDNTVWFAVEPPPAGRSARGRMVYELPGHFVLTAGKSEPENDTSVQKIHIQLGDRDGTPTVKLFGRTFKVVPCRREFTCLVPLRDPR